MKVVSGGEFEVTDDPIVVFGDGNDWPADWVIRYVDGTATLDTGHSCVLLSGPLPSTWSSALILGVQDLYANFTNWIRDNCQVNGTAGIGTSGPTASITVSCRLF